MPIESQPDDETLLHVIADEPLASTQSQSDTDQLPPTLQHDTRSSNESGEETTTLPCGAQTIVQGTIVRMRLWIRCRRELALGNICSCKKSRGEVWELSIRLDRFD